MNRRVRWLLFVLLMVALLLAAGWFGLRHWIGSDDFRARLQAQASDALGVAVLLGRVRVDVWPVPAVALEDVVVQTRPALAAQRLEVRPVLRPLLAGRLELATLLVRKADLPQAGIDQLLASMKKKSASGPAPETGAKGGPPDLVPRRVLLDGVTWRSAAGTATTLDAEAALNPQGLPNTVSLKVLAGQFQGSKAQLGRKDAVWDVKIDHAGGTIQGTVELQGVAPAGKDIVLQGQFQTRGVEISALAGKSGKGGPLSGRLDATTTVSARAPDMGSLLVGLQTQSKFTVRNAVVHGLDLARAVQSVGLSRGGETRLDNLSGQLHTKGKAVTLNNLAASSGVLSASGNVAMAANRALSGRVHVKLGAGLVGDAVGVPLVVSGTVDAPQVMLTRAAMLGAAIGTMVMPGVGTGAGASLGDKVGEKLKGLFGK